jgi:hypothetical protein
LLEKTHRSEPRIIFLAPGKPVIAIPIADYTLLGKSKELGIGVQELHIQRLVQVPQILLCDTEDLDHVFTQKLDHEGRNPWVVGAHHSS